jgi:Arc/MetJ-type ribon-helix-helix transcriptional regulator
MSQESENVRIPTWLYKKIEQRMPKDQFKSVSDYVCFVLSQVVSEFERKQSDQPYTPEDEEKVKDKLRALGYL